MAKTKPARTTAKKPNKIITGLNEALADLKSGDPAKVRMQWQLAPAATPERSEIEEAMTAASNEIEQLRRVNEVMGAKLHVLELFEMVLMTQPHQESQGMGEDIAWKLRKIVRDLRAVKEPAK